MKYILTLLVFISSLAIAQPGSNLTNYATSQTMNQATLDGGQLYNINQTTPGVTLTIPNPTSLTSQKNMRIRNIGSVSITLIPGGLLRVGKMIAFDWNGASYSTYDWGDQNSKENTIITGNSSQYYRGDKTWQNLPIQVNADWGSSSGFSQIMNKPSIFSGVYSDLTGKPSLFSGSYTDLTDKPSLFSGAYNDLSGKPTLFDGDYNSLANKPAIPTNTNQLTNGAGFITGFTELDPVWLSEKTNYYNKTASDGRYLQSFTETDPLVSAYAKSLTAFSVIKTSTDALYYPVSGNPSGFLTSFSEVDPNVPAYSKTLSAFSVIKSSTDPLYYPASGNPSGFLTSFTESDPLVSAYAKSLTAFSVIKSSTDPLYKAIGYTPSSAEITTALGFTPVTNARTLTLSAGTGISLSAGAQDLTANRTWTVTNTAPDQTVVLTAGKGITITGTYPSFTIAVKTPTITIRNTANSNARAVNSNFTISATLEALVSYTVTCQVTNPLLAGTSVATSFLEYSLDAGTTWQNPAQAANSSNVGVTVTLQLTNAQTGTLVGWIPANALTRIRTTTSGTATVTYITGEEITY